MEFNTKLYGGHRGARYAFTVTYKPTPQILKQETNPCCFYKVETPSIEPGIRCFTRHHANPTHRKFWREMLPRIKYRNPSIPISISRHTDPDGPSLLNIYTKAITPQQSPTAPASDTAPHSATPNPQTTLVPDTSTPTHTFNIKDQQESEILDALVKALGVTPIEPTEQEKMEMRELEERMERSEKDRVEVREKLLKERREQELLKMARGEVAATS